MEYSQLCGTVNFLVTLDRSDLFIAPFSVIHVHYPWLEACFLPHTVSSSLNTNRKQCDFCANVPQKQSFVI